MAMLGVAPVSILLAIAISTPAAGQTSTQSEDPLPSNLKAGAFQSVLEKMWQLSPTFRRQCARLAAERGLTVRLRAEGVHASASARARTEISRTGGSLFADIVVLEPGDAIELIAHEIEHLIEQIDGVQLTGNGCGSGGSRGTSETCRAIEAGQRVAREVSEARAIHFSTVQQRDRFSGPPDAPTAAISASGRIVVLRSNARLTPDDMTDAADLHVLDAFTIFTSSELLSVHPGRFVELLSTARPLPVSAADKARILSTLPKKGEIVELDGLARRKLAQLRAVLRVVGRESIYELKVVDVPLARMGLYDRAVVLLSAPLLRLLDADELRALITHEIGHEYVWAEYERRSKLADQHRLKELELVCDGIAVMILRELRIDASRLIAAIEKVTRFNRHRFGSAVNEEGYPTVAERRAFVRAVREWAEGRAPEWAGVGAVR